MLAVLSFFPSSYRDRAQPWAERIPLVLLLLVQAILSLRLRNTAFEDEALYIDAGHDYLAHWFQGAPLPDYGSFFSGTPVVYPVFAALVDTVGGLALVRLTSLAMMLAATWCVWRITDHLWGLKAGNLAAAVFVVTSSVTLVGTLATFDAPALLLLALALYYGVTRRSYRSAAVMGVIMAVAVLNKYTAAAFLPVVLGLTVVTATRWARAAARAFLGAAVAAAILLAMYWLSTDSIREGVAVTTTNRSALLPAPLRTLAGFAAMDVGLLLLLAVAGCVVVIRSFRSLAVAGGLLAGALLLPVAQMRLGELVSFEKHLAYSALFLAPLAGRALLAMLSHRLGPILVMVTLIVVSICGLPRSNAMYQGWPPVDHVVQVVESNPVPGQYFSTSARSMAYYTREDHPDIRWEEQYGLYAAGRGEIQQAVAGQRYEKVVLRTRFTGTPDDLQKTAYFSQLLAQSPNYRLTVPPLDTRPFAPDQWLIYERASS